MTQTVILLSFQGIMSPLHCAMKTGNISPSEPERSHQTSLRLRWKGIELCAHTTSRSELPRTRLARQGTTWSHCATSFTPHELQKPQNGCKPYLLSNNFCNLPRKP